MTDCGCTNFPASLGNVTFGASVGISVSSPAYSLDVGPGTVQAAVVQATDHLAVTEGGYPRVESDVAETPLFVGATSVTSGNALVVAKNNFADSANWLLVVTAGGSVGIGKASPAQALDVAGTVRATGLLLGGDILLYGALKDPTGTRTNVDATGCYYAS